MIQRFASWSYWTIGSPSLFVEQSPPNPDQIVLPAAGPYSTLPVVLSKTANDRLTHCTYCVRPASPTVSGGATLTLYGNCGLPSPTPSKPTPLVAANGATTIDWMAGSACAACGGRGGCFTSKS